MSMISSISMRTCTLSYKKIHNVPIVYTFVCRKIFVYILKFVFPFLLQALFKFNPMMLNVSKLLKNNPTLLDHFEKLFPLL